MPAESETPPFTTQADEPAPSSPEAPASPFMREPASSNDTSGEHPEYYVGAAFAGGFVLARAIKWLGRNRD